MLKRLRHPLAAAGLALAVAVAGIGLLVLPQRDRSGRLDREIASTRVQVASASAFVKEYHPEALDSADLFRLSKAMPSSVGMPDLLLQLQRVADSAGVVLDSVAPRAVQQRTGYRAIPIALTASGSFYSVSDFLLRLRSSVRVRGSNLDVTGRLYSVLDVSLRQPVRGRDLQVSLTVSAYAFAGAAPLPASPKGAR